ncbi:cobalt-precorrin-5B (C(1))-methyltransferase [Xanthocytophaga flava]|uniref:cobalt-precorrin-5B (C(1))-methyltransferase n=1 Tax=Xanthocytophaga flava TaxID=3048013 RepID=UPI0028D16174|nr:cobalt-precorrin-5B (C(1))-methyltransferase [Xanthocytophaga flavus]MDJ1467416.1 cobalt-precorrin-5B (C(1))-methyltransferase [Xanthocytophaga flavus]
MSLQPIPSGPLRTGYTTGSCATACAKAALLALIKQTSVQQVDIELPIGETASFRMNSCQYSLLSASCSTIKDAGDDPDVTHGAEIGCKVSWNNNNEIIFLRGEGVGIVTLPGLAIDIGEPAINPVPRQMMIREVSQVLQSQNIVKGVNLEVFVVNGSELAKKTLNARLGIIGGLSILGTTGIVKPFSASAYIASIEQGIDVALANGCTDLIINSGGRTEKQLKKRYPHLPGYAFIQYGNWIGETLQKIKMTPVSKVVMGIMLGKAVKLAKGDFNTHSDQSSWDKDFIIRVATESGYPSAICSQIQELTMARRLTELFPFTENEPFYQTLCSYCYQQCISVIPEVSFSFLLFDANDQMISYHLHY